MQKNTKFLSKEIKKVCDIKFLSLNKRITNLASIFGLCEAGNPANFKHNIYFIYPFLRILKICLKTSGILLKLWALKVTNAIKNNRAEDLKIGENLQIHLVLPFWDPKFLKHKIINN